MSDVFLPLHRPPPLLFHYTGVSERARQEKHVQLCKHMHRLNLCVRADEVQMCLCEHSYAHNNAFWCVRQGQELPISLSEWVGSEVGRQYMRLYMYMCVCVTATCT